MGEVTTRFQKGVLILLAAVTLLSAALVGVMRSREGVRFNDALLKEQITEAGRIYTGKAYGETFTVTVTREGETATAVDVRIGERLYDRYLVEYPLESIQTENGSVPGLRVTKNGEEYFAGGYDRINKIDGFGYFIYDSSGEWFLDDLVTFTVSNGYEDVFGNGWEDFELAIQELLTFADGPELESRGVWGFWLLGLLTALVGALEAIFPEALFRLNHRWYVKDPEPTEFYFFMNRVGICVLTAMAIVFYIMAIVKFP